MGKIFKFPKKARAVETRITTIEKTLRESSPSIENLEDLQTRIINLENAWGNILNYLNDFTPSTSTKAGARGLVPTPPQTDQVIVLTNSGWQKFTPADLYISELPTIKQQLTYNRQAQTPEWNNYDPLKLVIGGDYKNITDAGTYIVSFTPSGDLTWSDNTRTTRYVEYTIAPKKVAVPTLSNTAKTYNKAAQSPTISTYDSAEISVSDNSKTAAGNYSVKFNLTSTKNYVWTDGTTATKTAAWTIAVLKLAKPSSSSTTLTYSGNTQPLSVSNFNSNYMTRKDYQAIDAGNYSAVYTLSDKTNTQWSDGSTTDVSIAWKIEPLKLAKVTATKTVYDYTGEKVSLEVTNYNSTFINRSGTYEATTPNDNYSAVYSLKSTTNTKWADGSTGSITLSWQIKQQLITVPTWDNATLTYNKQAQTAVFNNYDSATMTVTGDKQTNAGNYSATFKLKDTTSTKWADGTTADKNVSWKIEKATVNIPSLAGETIYFNTNSQSPTLTGYDSSLMYRGGDYAATDAGTYNLLVYLHDTDNYQWSDKTSGEKTVKWSISKKIIQDPVWVGPVIYDGNLQTAEFTFSDWEWVTVTGDEQTEPGTYQAVFTLKDANNTRWSSSSTTVTVRKNWTISRQTLPDSVVSNLDGANFPFEGWVDAGTQAFTRTYDLSHLQISTITPSGMKYDQDTGTWSYRSSVEANHCLAAGAHQISFKPQTGYAWADGSTGSKTFNFTVLPSSDWGHFYFDLDLNGSAGTGTADTTARKNWSTLYGGKPTYGQTITVNSPAVGSQTPRVAPFFAFETSLGSAGWIHPNYTFAISSEDVPSMGKVTGSITNQEYELYDTGKTLCNENSVSQWIAKGKSSLTYKFEIDVPNYELFIFYVKVQF